MSVEDTDVGRMDVRISGGDGGEDAELLPEGLYCLHWACEVDESGGAARARRRWTRAGVSTRGLTLKATGTTSVCSVWLSSGSARPIMPTKVGHFCVPAESTKVATTIFPAVCWELSVPPPLRGSVKDGRWMLGGTVLPR